MTIPVATALGRRDRTWPAVLVSAAVHAGLIGWALWVSSQPEISLAQRPIAAKLVRLGEKRPDSYLPQKPVEPAAPAAEPAPVPAPPVAAAPPAPAPQPGPPAPAAKPDPTAKPAPRTASTTTGAPGSRAGGSAVGSVLAGARRAQDREREQWGDPNGVPGGDAESGAEGDRYLALVRHAIQSRYQLPATLSDQERLHLEAVVVLNIEPDGRISRWRVDQPSGNGVFDSALERTLSEVQRVPPPPPTLRETFRAGVKVQFAARNI